MPVGPGLTPLWDHLDVLGSHQGHSMVGLGIPLCTKKLPRAGKRSRETCKRDCRAGRISWGGKIRRILSLWHALLPGHCLPVPVIFCNILVLLLKGPLKSLMTQIQSELWSIPRRDAAVISSVCSVVKLSQSDSRALFSSQYMLKCAVFRGNCTSHGHRAQVLQCCPEAVQYSLKTWSRFS